MKPGTRVRVVQHPDPLMFTPRIGQTGTVVATYGDDEWADVRFDGKRVMGAHPYVELDIIEVEP